MSEHILPLTQQLLNIPKNERKDFIKEKYNFYRSGPEGCLQYLQENIYYPSGGNYKLIDFWDIQRKMILDITEFLFDKKRELYVILGSRQCGKSYTMDIISDYLMVCFKGYNIVMLHADETRGKENLNNFKNIIENKDPMAKLKPKINRELKYSNSNNSQFIVIPTQKSSKTSDTGRSLTSNLLWIDEAAFVDLEKLESSVFPTTSQSFIQSRKDNMPFGIILSSSANGRKGIGKRFFEFWKQAEGNMTSDGMTCKGITSGFKLLYHSIPGKGDNQEWVESQKHLLGERKFNQEFECVFLGGESTFFEDKTIQNIQKRTMDLTYNKFPKFTSSTFISKTSGEKFEINQYIPITSDTSYLIGIDVSKCTGNDYHVLEVFDYYTMEQVLEVKHNKAKNEDFGDLVDFVVRDIILKNYGKCILGIENNLGYSLISYLFTKDPIYKSIIYRDTIGPDNKKDKNANFLKPYNECMFGIATTTLTRPMIISELYSLVSSDVSIFNSVYMLNEIESLEMKDGFVEGAVHDDTVFALGMILLLKKKSRASMINSIFDMCKDFWDDEGKNKYGVSGASDMTIISDEEIKGVSDQVPMMSGIMMGSVLSGTSIDDASNIELFREGVSEMKNNMKSFNLNITSMGNYSTRKINKKDRMKRSDEEYTADELEKSYSENWADYIV